MMASAAATTRVPEPATEARRRILFLADAPRTFEQQLAMARALEATGRWEAWFMPLAALDQDGPIGVRVWPLSAAAIAPVGVAAADNVAPSRGRVRRWLGSLMQRRAMTLPRELLLALLQGRAWRQQRTTARVRLAALGASCLVTAQERDDTALPIVAAAQDLSIPTILISAAGLYMPDGGAYMRRASPPMKLDPEPGAGFGEWSQILLNRLVGWLEPGHVFASRWGRMMHRPAHWYLAAWFAGLGLRSGWFQGTRFIDVVVVSGDDELRVCRAAGIPDHRIAAIGSPGFQMHHERMRERLRIRAQLGIAQDRPLLIASPPPLWEHRMIGRDEHFAFIDELLAVLARSRCTVIVSLHPKLNRADYEPRVRAMGGTIAEQPLTEILAAADLFVSGGYSSTIRWALAIGIPSANLDLWELNEGTYRDDSDYPTLRSLEALGAWIAAARDRPPGPRQSEKPPLGLICDGRFHEHLAELVERIALPVAA
jgi:hypothetical protein